MSDQCQGITKKGNQCSNKAKNGSYCMRHKPTASSSKSSPQEQPKRGDGSLKNNHRLKMSSYSITDINARINTEYNADIENSLSDEQLQGEYAECESVKNKISELSGILEKYVNKDIQRHIIEEYTSKLIPAGTKGVIRGNKFNQIIKNEIMSLSLDQERYDIVFEKKCPQCVTDEKPDWYILDKSTNKILIGMNQLDLWGGGQQLNRGFKYIKNNPINTDNQKLVCVVCKHIKFTGRSKACELFEIGFQNDTLCYTNNLKNIINSYFE